MSLSLLSVFKLNAGDEKPTDLSYFIDYSLSNYNWTKLDNKWIEY